MPMSRFDSQYLGGCMAWDGHGQDHPLEKPPRQPKMLTKGEENPEWIQEK